jgi:16S rRNA C967 or C1407 C5-methylase (RsmB/RsmF family)
MHPRRSLRFQRLAPRARELAELCGIEVEGAVPWCADGVFLKEGSLLRPDTHPFLGAGLGFLQEAGAMEAVEMLAPREGERVLDLCAAPGAKSTQIGECLAGRGWLVANDPQRARAAKLDALLARHGIANVSVHSTDPERLARVLPAAFDAILVDAPCSGESLFAKRKEQRSDVRDSEVSACARRQKSILASAAAMLAPGGRILYSTCTYSREENEDVVEDFLARAGNFRLERSQRRWPHKDGVAGGFAALLVNGDAAASRAAGAPTTEEGLIRRGFDVWDGNRDEYAAAMARTERVDFAASLELEEAAAREYLTGAAVPLAEGDARVRGAGLSRVLWKGEPIGAAKIVAGRANNFLPKILRGLSR